MSEVALWLDTNVAWSPAKVRQLAALARKKGVRVVVHAQVHLEIWRQRHVKDGEKFSPNLVESFLRQLGIEVFDVALDRVAAEKWGKMLARRYPTDEAWRGAKLQAVKATLPDEAVVPAHRVPMTTDWLIALAIEEHDGYIAVEDRGEEWSALRGATPKRALTFQESLAWLQDLPDSPAAPASARP